MMIRTSSNVSPTTPPRVLFVGSLFAGHRTRFANLRAHTADDPRIQAEYRAVSGWVEDGLIERANFLPIGLRGRIRSTSEAMPLARIPRPDVIWTSVGDLIAPFAWSQLGLLRRPLVLDMDSTPAQLEANAQYFWGRPPHSNARRALATLRVALVNSCVSRFAAWSQWASEGLINAGIVAERIRIIPPGVDLDLWHPAPHQRGRSIRVLFVGADFVRKGGPLLLEAVRSRTDRFELDIVTRSELPSTSWYRVHRAEPNSQELRNLFARADLFVLPTRAECFGIAAVEAMACGLPVVMGNSGAANEIVDDCVSGYVISPEPGELGRVLDAIAGDPQRLERMGWRGRAIAEQRFDGRHNDRLVVDLLLEEHERYRAGETPRRESRRLESFSNEARR